MSESKETTKRHVPVVRHPIGTPLGNLQSINEATGEFKRYTGEHRIVNVGRWGWIVIVATIVVVSLPIIIYVISKLQ